MPSTYYVRNVMGAHCRYSARPPVVYTSQKEGRGNADSNVLRILSTGAREASRTRRAAAGTAEEIFLPGDNHQ